MGKPAATIRLLRAPTTSLRVILSNAGDNVAADVAAAEAAVDVLAAAPLADKALFGAESVNALPA